MHKVVFVLLLAALPARAGVCGFPTSAFALPTALKLVSAKFPDTQYDLKSHPDYDPDAIFLGLNETGSVTVVAGQVVLRGKGSSLPATVSGTRYAIRMDPGAFVRINVPERNLKLAEEAIRREVGKTHLSCLHAACKVLNAADVTIEGVNGRLLKIKPFMAGLADGKILIDGKAIDPANLKTVITSTKSDMVTIRDEMIEAQDMYIAKSSGFAIMFGTATGTAAGIATGLYYVVYAISELF